VGFVVDKVAARQPFSPSTLVFPCPYYSTVALHTGIYHLGMNNRPVSDRSSETQPHSIDMFMQVTGFDFLVQVLRKGRTDCFAPGTEALHWKIWPYIYIYIYI
jgi:hypothetical protein